MCKVNREILTIFDQTQPSNEHMIWIDFKKQSQPNDNKNRLFLLSDF